MSEKKDLVLEILSIIQDQLIEIRAEMATKADLEVLRAQIARMDQRITTFTLSHRVESATRNSALSERIDGLEARVGTLEDTRQD